MENGDSFELVTLHITSNLTSTFSERRFSKSLCIGELKGKLELLTGANARSMALELLDPQGAHLAHLKDDFASLASCGVENGMRIHVTDESQPVGVFDEDVAEAERFRLSTEEYKQKDGTVHDFLRKNRLGKYSEEYTKKLEEEKLQAAEKASRMKVGDRCQVTVAKNPIRRGQVMYIGEVDFKPGVWIGVKYDEPLGKNDGSVKGKRYFECLPNYGGFVNPLDMEVGDFPEELDVEDDLEEM